MEDEIIKAEIDKTDAELDAMVYELYGLSEEEINIVEGELIMDTFDKYQL